MSRTVFPTAPGDVAVLTPAEFVFDEAWNQAPSFEEICLRFANDANRALVWYIRYRALEAWRAREGIPGWLNAPGRTARHINEVAAGLELNDCWEFDVQAFCRAVDALAAERTRRERRR